MEMNMKYECQKGFRWLWLVNGESQKKIKVVILFDEWETEIAHIKTIAPQKSYLVVLISSILFAIHFKRKKSPF